MPVNGFHSNAARAQALTLLGIGWTHERIFELTSIPIPTLKDIKKRAR
jgi:hypothetical protein